jgi:hypothetical protein
VPPAFVESSQPHIEGGGTVRTLVELTASGG